MSGGVDSSVAAALLLRSGHPRENLQPFYMANWSPAANPVSMAPARLPYNKPRQESCDKQVQYVSQSEKCTEKEFNDVKAVCYAMGLKEPLYMSFEKEYWNEVFMPMVEMYQQAKTPNPDVECNRQIKFGTVIKRLENEFERNVTIDGKGRKWWMATGHYAHVLNHIPTNSAHLLRSCDPNKDQTFYLSMIPPSVLPRLIFPLGSHSLSKPAVKALARELSLPGWRSGEPERPESMGLCFVEPGGGRGKSGFRRWLQEYLEPEPGNIVIGPPQIFPPNQESNIQPHAAPEGMVIGKHKGLWHATIGERSHYEFPQGDPRFVGKWYVSRKYKESNTLEVVKGLDNARLFGKGMIMEDWRWLGEDAQRVALQIFTNIYNAKDNLTWGNGLVTQFRHRQKPLKVIKVEIIERLTLSKSATGGANRLKILFESPERSVTPGQSAALWFGKRCLGGGIIESAVDLD
ncbi:tRNA-specific 2-thiouridylase [Morchella snyderi]|nr:tRNA-specific 2-thiouridylase [Morchella snyderi]